MDAYWITFYEFPEKFLGINYKPNDSERLKLWSQLSKSCSWFWCYENYCFIADRPTEIHFNNENRLNKIDGPAIKWIDGYEIYYVNGREISKTNFDKIKSNTYTIEDFFNEPNEEVKSVCLQFMIELYGDGYIATFFNSVLKEVDTYVDKKNEKYLKGTTKGMNVGVYTLFKGSLNGYEIAYTRCFCPSSDRLFYLGCETHHNNAKDAIASLYTVPAKLKPYIKNIGRQGERYSTTFTEKGIKIAKNLKKEELEDLISISGNEYFSKISYEY